MAAPPLGLGLELSWGTHTALGTPYSYEMETLGVWVRHPSPCLPDTPVGGRPYGSCRCRSRPFLFSAGL